MHAHSPWVTFCALCAAFFYALPSSPKTWPSGWGTPCVETRASPRFSTRRTHNLCDQYERNTKDRSIFQACEQPYSQRDLTHPLVKEPVSILSAIKIKNLSESAVAVLIFRDQNASIGAGKRINVSASVALQHSTWVQAGGITSDTLIRWYIETRRSGNT